MSWFITCAVLLAAMQVSFTSFFDCNKWCGCIFLWVLFWENSSDKTLSKEDLGGFYWRISYYHNLCLSGENLSFLRALLAILAYTIQFESRKFSCLLNEPVPIISSVVSFCCTFQCSNNDSWLYKTYFKVWAFCFLK